MNNYYNGSYYYYQSQPLFNSVNEGTQANPEQHRYTYNIKIINPKKRSQFVMEKFRRFNTFKSVDEIREAIREECHDSSVSDGNFDVGYLKGRGKIWIKDEEDISSMYKLYGYGPVNMWCHGDGYDDESENTVHSGTKRHSTEDNLTKPSKRQAIREEVEEIFSELQEKHSSAYTPAQLRLWANMLQVGTHKDYDNPPNVPMFGKVAKKRETGMNDALSSIAEGVIRALKGTPQCDTPQCYTSTSMPTGASPNKRSQCIEQIKQLHQLFEINAITKEEYEQQKTNILSKML